MVTTPEVWTYLAAADDGDPSAVWAPDIIQLANGDLLIGWTLLQAGEGNPDGGGRSVRRYDLEGRILDGALPFPPAAGAQMSRMAVLPTTEATVSAYLAATISSDAGTARLVIDRRDATGSVIHSVEVALSAAADFFIDVALSVSSQTSALLTYIENTSTTGLGADRVMFAIYDAKGGVSAPCLLYTSDAADE